MSNFNHSQAIATSNGVAYSSGDCVGSLYSINAANFTAGTDKILHALKVTDLAKQNSGLTILLFKEHPAQTPFTDNAALDIHDSNLSMLWGKIKVESSDYASFNDSSMADKDSLGKPLPGNFGGLFWFSVMSDGTPTYSSTSDLNIEFFFT